MQLNMHVATQAREVRTHCPTEVVTKTLFLFYLTLNHDCHIVFVLQTNNIKRQYVAVDSSQSNHSQTVF
jgi:hypothetical protein